LSQAKIKIYFLTGDRNALNRRDLSSGNAHMETHGGKNLVNIKEKGEN